MKRYYCMLVVFTLCLIVAGCRRGAATPRAPVKIAIENDILKGPKEVELQFNSRPVDRKYRLLVESSIKLDEELKNAGEGARKKRLGDVLKIQEEMEKDNQSRDQLQKMREIVDEEEQLFEFAPFGLAASKYLELKKTNMPKEYLEIEFYKWLRREELKVPRKFLDRVDMAIVSDQIPLYKFLGSRFTFVTDVDMDGKEYIVAYGDSVFQFNGEKKYTTAPSDMIQKMIQKQELRLVRHHFVGYCGPLHIRPPADQKEAAEVLFKNVGYRNHEDVVKAMQYGVPAQVIGRFEGVIPQFIINPPGQVDVEKFALHLRDKAPPSLKSPLEDRVISLNKDVNWRDPNDLVACRTAVDTVEDPNSKQKIVLGHLSVNTAGNVTYAPTVRVQRFLQQPPEEKSGGMPSGFKKPKMGGMMP